VLEHDIANGHLTVARERNLIIAFDRHNGGRVSPGKTCGTHINRVHPESPSSVGRECTARITVPPFGRGSCLRHDPRPSINDSFRCSQVSLRPSPAADRCNCRTSTSRPLHARHRRGSVRTPGNPRPPVCSTSQNHIPDSVRIRRMSVPFSICAPPLRPGGRSDIQPRSWSGVGEHSGSPGIHCRRGTCQSAPA
jgi:hypothetical protein